MDKLTTYFPRMPPNASPELYLQPLVWLAFSSGLLLIRASSWKRLVGDISVALLCIALHFLQLSMLSVAIAIGYAICYGTPGCFVRSDLPSRAAFMRGLTVTASQEHCNICHDDVERLASLPCGDFCCAGCFLATKVCTVCPYMYCKNPLYDQDHDRRHATLIKGLHACLALAHGFGSYVAGHCAKQGSFVTAGLLLGAAGSSLCIYLALLTYQVCSARSLKDYPASFVEECFGYSTCIFLTCAVLINFEQTWQPLWDLVEFSEHAWCSSVIL